jgi:hypothetical protein
VRAVVRLLYTQEPVPWEDDSWAGAPMSETGLVGFGEGEEAHYRGRRLAPLVAVCLLRAWRPTSKEYDSWARAPESEAGPLLSAEMKRRGGSLSRGSSPSSHSETDAQGV